MSITEEYVKRAEECVRLAGACIAESNRQILLYTAAHWRMLAESEAKPAQSLHYQGRRCREAAV